MPCNPPKNLVVGIVQFNSGPAISDNLNRIRDWIRQAADQGVAFVAFPETVAIRDNQLPVSKRITPIDGEFVSAIQVAARQHHMWILIGSVFTPTFTPLRASNTSILINPTGDIVTTYEKLHLFDATIPTGQSITESASCAPGSRERLVPIAGILTGLSICYDLRFPELYRHYSAHGAKLLAIPAAFTYPTGVRDWEILLRARAIENQAYVIAPNQIGIGPGNVPSYGHSMIIDPSGIILAEGDETSEQLLTATLDFTKLAGLRQTFPVLTHRRFSITRNID